MFQVPLFAQGVNWRSDFSEARREAAKTNKPILLDFGTAGCSWCVKQDATTFRDPAVIRLLNEHFIPLKIDADRDPRRAEAMGIHSFPTIVIAGSDGKVLDRHAGYVEARELLAILAKIRKQLPAPEADTPVAAAQEDETIIRCRVSYETSSAP